VTESEKAIKVCLNRLRDWMY